jgi:phosphate transport system ATP-binding protein
MLPKLTVGRSLGLSEFDLAALKPKFEVEHFNFWYPDKHALKDISLVVPEKCVTALIGPSGCGKSTLLRSLNRMNDYHEGVKRSGRVMFEGQDIHGPSVDATALRRRVGMIFQKSNPFPKSVFENVAFGPKVAGLTDTAKLQDIVERSLKLAALWDDVKTRLHSSALSLSGGQQQRLCIARALATNPEVLLLDEPASALDPHSTNAIEDLLYELKRDYTIVIVTHNMQQAARVSDVTAFLEDGALVEFGPTDRIFTKPHEDRTEMYITGRFG